LSVILEAYLEKNALTYIHLSSETLELLNQNFQRVEIRKKDYLIHAGDKELYLYFIESGILRYWILDRHLQEITFAFAFAGEFANSYYSFCKDTKSEFDIQALTDCVIWKVNRNIIFDMFKTSLEINILARVVMENIFTKKIQREIELLKYTIEERYRILIIRDKNMLKEIPLKYLASYLGSTPQSLSRIRKKIF
ncbi:Crp/Fnr family transcriptional regulator, partial [uncultured Bacteroides sp.]